MSGHIETIVAPPIEGAANHEEILADTCAKLERCKRRLDLLECFLAEIGHRIERNGNVIIVINNEKYMVTPYIKKAEDE